MNVGLDICFVYGLHMDVAGAAWATFISQAACCVLTVIPAPGAAAAINAVLTVSRTFLLSFSPKCLAITTEQPPFIPKAKARCGICSALGDSKTPFIFLVISSVMNVGLDIYFAQTETQRNDYGAQRRCRDKRGIDRLTCQLNLRQRVENAFTVLSAAIRQRVGAAALFACRFARSGKFCGGRSPCGRRYHNRRNNEEYKRCFAVPQSGTNSAPQIVEKHEGQRADVYNSAARWCSSFIRLQICS